MAPNSISSTINQTRKKLASRRRKINRIFADGVVTDAEMARLRENFNEAYYDICILRDMIQKQKKNIGKQSGNKRAALESQIKALEKAEKLVFDSYCRSILSLKRANKLRKTEATKTVHNFRVLKVQLSPEELALLYGVIHSSKELRTKGTPEQKKAAERKIKQVVKLIQNGERNKKVLLAVLEEEHTR